MQFDLTDGESAFRARLREFLDSQSPPRDRSFEAGLLWQKTLHEYGWVAPLWPKEFGGLGCTPTEYTLYLEEMGRRQAPQLAGRVGINMIGPTLLQHGTPEQCTEYLPRILSSEDIWCELFSEPDAGSDLGAVRTRAERSGDDWIVTGGKVWTSFANEATMGVILARTGTRADGRAELSYLICSMDSPGVEVRPLRQMTGETEFAEVFLDGVRVPAYDIIGAPGDGWNVMRTTLDNERGLAYPWKEQVVLEGMVNDLIEAAKLRPDLSPHQRLAIVDDVIRSRIFRLLNVRTLSNLAAGGRAGAFASVTKLFWSTYAQHLQQTRFEFDGLDAIAGDENAWRSLLWYRQASIAGGTSEIQRNIVAEQLLGLPREARGG